MTLIRAFQPASTKGTTVKSDVSYNGPLGNQPWNEQSVAALVADGRGKFDENLVFWMVHERVGDEASMKEKTSWVESEMKDYEEVNKGPYHERKGWSAPKEIDMLGWHAMYRGDKVGKEVGTKLEKLGWIKYEKQGQTIKQEFGYEEGFMGRMSTWIPSEQHRHFMTLWVACGAFKFSKED